MQIEEMRQKLFDKLIGTSWDNELRFFVKSSEFDDILLNLMLEVDTGFRFTPVLNDIFKPFELCPYDKVKVVFIYPEPYADPTLNDGLALSNKATDRDIPVIFNRFKEELNAQFPINSIQEADLSSWTSQGVLLLNESLTTRISTPGRHTVIWEPFINYIMDILVRKDLIFVFIGNHSFEDVEGIQLAALPNAYNSKWNSNDLFLNINKLLVEKNLSEIIW